jgi:hypothetical protein
MGGEKEKKTKEERCTVHYKFDNSCLSYTLFQPKKSQVPKHDAENVVIYTVPTKS